MENTLYIERFSKMKSFENCSLLPMFATVLEDVLCAFH